MGKKLQQAGDLRSTTQVVFGWLLFGLSFVIENSFSVFVLQAGARALPRWLNPSREPYSLPPPHNKPLNQTGF